MYKATHILFTGSVPAEFEMSELLDRITIDPAVRSGKPVICGTRITVSDVLEYLATGCPRVKYLRIFLICPTRIF